MELLKTSQDKPRSDESSSNGSSKLGKHVRLVVPDEIRFRWLDIFHDPRPKGDSQPEDPDKDFLKMMRILITRMKMPLRRQKYQNLMPL